MKIINILVRLFFLHITSNTINMQPLTLIWGIEVIELVYKFLIDFSVMTVSYNENWGN